MLKILFTMVHLIVSIILILVVLLQTGKRADLAGAFGGGGSQTAFGARGAATLLSKATAICAILFMITSLGLSILSSRGPATGTTVLEDLPPSEQTAPATPGETAPPADEGAPVSFPELPASDADAAEEPDPVTLPPGTPLEDDSTE